MVKFKSTDFLHASTRVRSLETNLLTLQRLEQMVDAATPQDAFRMIQSAGIGVGMELGDYEKALKQNLLDAYGLMAQIGGNSDWYNIFRYEYDGLNLKVIIKSQAMDHDPDPYMTELGITPPEELRKQFHARSYSVLHPALIAGANEAVDTLARTGDPQRVDVILDKAVLAAMSQKASEMDNAFIRGLVARKIDISNIRCIIRIKRMNKDVDFLKSVLSPGGIISADSMAEAYSKGLEPCLELIRHSDYANALEESFNGIREGGPLSLFEKLCDNYMTGLLNRAKLVPFGIEPLVAYLCAKEVETKSIRIVLTSKLAGIDSRLILERLRDTYAK